MLRAIDCGDAGRLQRGGDDAVCAGVDNGSGAAGLAQDAGAFQFTHGYYLLIFHPGKTGLVFVYIGKIILP
ncbi:hypothetical protein SDC9_187654 [bioreactor metagenome]|uniref:Uncharacterized protein n=1 Tax=bioreactor metagenome TaxID=1076179 RepID=A0A645HPE9_9ZZZZ